MKTKKLIIVALILTLLASTSLFAKTKKTDEKRFQLGFGITASTGSILTLIDNIQMVRSIKNSDQDYPGLSDEEAKALNTLSSTMQKSIMVANILGSFEYGAQMRIKWHMLLAHADLIFLPNDYSKNGRFDFLVGMNVGIRAPFFIQPYLTAGINFTFSWYPKFDDADFKVPETWKGSWGTVDNFMFRPGMNVVAGLDIKFKRLSLGVYYKYTIKDFGEFSAWFSDLTDDLKDADYANAQAKAAGMIFGYQSRFGAAITLYVF
ncbi:MAG: hypothetical protein MJB14_09190 [Spirochaetes bacterium]|nr:hypothetical protein [Spirochaetota bacterium]